MVIESQEHVRFVTGAEHFARANPDLKNRRPTRNRGRDRHESHYLLLAPSSQAGEKAADCLNAILGIARDPDDRFRYLRDFGSAARGGGGHGCFAHEMNSINCSDVGWQLRTCI